MDAARDSGNDPEADVKEITGLFGRKAGSLTMEKDGNDMTRSDLTVSAEEMERQEQGQGICL